MYLRSQELGWTYCVLWAGIQVHFSVLPFICLILCIDFLFRLESITVSLMATEIWISLLHPKWSQPQLLKKSLDSLWLAHQNYPCSEGNGLMLVFQAQFWVASVQPFFSRSCFTLVVGMLVNMLPLLTFSHCIWKICSKLPEQRPPFLLLLLIRYVANGKFLYFSKCKII